MKRRKLDIAVISDVHLGTYGCRASELHNYLKTINPKILILDDCLSAVDTETEPKKTESTDKTS